MQRVPQALCTHDLPSYYAGRSATHPLAKEWPLWRPPCARYGAHLVPWLRYSQRGRENSGKRKDCMGAAYDRLSTGLRWQVIYIYIYIYMHIYTYICLAPLLARGMPGSNTNTTLCARNSVCLQDDFCLCRLTQMAGAQRTCALRRRDTQRVVRGRCMFSSSLISCRPRSLRPSTWRCSALCLHW